MFEFLNDDKLFNNDEKVVELSNKEKLLLEANKVEISMESAEPKSLLDSVLRDATSEDRERVERTETIKIACEDIQSFIPQTIAMEREMAEVMTRWEIFTIYPGLVYNDIKTGIKRIGWNFLDFGRDLLTLSHIRGFIKIIANKENDNVISRSKKSRIDRYLQWGGAVALMEQSLLMAASLTFQNHKEWMDKTPTKPVIEITLIDSDNMVGATYMSIDTSGFNSVDRKEAEIILAEMSKRMLGVVQRKGIEYGVELKNGVVKNKLNPNKLEAVVYSPIKLTD